MASGKAVTERLLLQGVYDFLHAEEHLRPCSPSLMHACDSLGWTHSLDGFGTKGNIEVPMARSAVGVTVHIRIVIGVGKKQRKCRDR